MHDRIVHRNERDRQHALNKRRCYIYYLPELSQYIKGRPRFVCKSNTVIVEMSTDILCFNAGHCRTESGKECLLAKYRDVDSGKNSLICRDGHVVLIRIVGCTDEDTIIWIC